MTRLQNEAYDLMLKIRAVVEDECWGGRYSRSVGSVRKERLHHAYARSKARVDRRFRGEF